MGRILFFDKEIKYNLPDYSLALLHELKKRGHEILVCLASKNNFDFSKILNISHSSIYSSYPIKSIETLDDGEKLLKKFKPHVFLTSFSCHGFSRDFSKIAKLRYQCKLVEMDTIASEIMLYNKNWNLLQPSFSFRSGLLRTLRILNSNYFKNNLPLPVNKDYEVFSDAIALKGNWFKSYLLNDSSLTKHQSKLVVTGSIHLDKIKKFKSKKGEIFRKMNFRTSKKLVIIGFMKSIIDSSESYFSDFALNEIREKLDVNIAILPHPQAFIEENLGKYEKYSVPIIPPGQIYSYLKYTDAFVVPHSSIGIETSIFEVPIVISSVNRQISEIPYFLNRKPSFYRYSMKDDYNVGKSVNDNELIPILEKILSDEIKFDFSRFNRDFSNSIDGKSHIRISDIIEVLLEHR